MSKKRIKLFVFSGRDFDGIGNDHRITLVGTESSLVIFQRARKGKVPNIVLVDITTGNGDQVLAAVREKYRNAKIIILIETLDGREAEVATLLQQGVTSFCLVSDSVPALVERITAARDGRIHRMTSALEDAIAATRVKSTTQGQVSLLTTSPVEAKTVAQWEPIDSALFPRLTTRQRQVLGALLYRPEASNRELAEMVKITPGNVSFQLSTALDRLEVPKRIPNRRQRGLEAIRAKTPDSRRPAA